MRLQLYLSPELSDRLAKNALDRNMSPRELADKILKDYFGITDEEKDYQTTLNSVINEIELFLMNKKGKETFTLLDFESFRSIGTSALRSAVGRGVAKHFKECKEIEYLRNENGEICRTPSTHAAIYRIVNGADKK